jgi:hypothetical protein
MHTSSAAEVMPHYTTWKAIAKNTWRGEDEEQGWAQ